MAPDAIGLAVADLELLCHPRARETPATSTADKSPIANHQGDANRVSATTRTTISHIGR
jgi:hypothetical protein